MQLSRPIKTFTLIFILLAAPVSLAKELQVCIIDEPYAPISFPSGVEAPAQRLVKLAAQHTGNTVIFYPAPWKRCLHLVKYGSLDAILGAVNNPTFAATIRFPVVAGNTDPSKSVGNIVFRVYRKVGSVVNWDGEQFHHLTTPVLRGTGIEIVRQKLALLDIPSNEVKTPMQAISMVALDRATVSIAREIEAQEHLEREKLTTEVEALPIPFDSKPVYLAVSLIKYQQNPGYYEAIWNAIAAINQGKIAE